MRGAALFFKVCHSKVCYKGTALFSKVCHSKVCYERGCTVFQGLS